MLTPPQVQECLYRVHRHLLEHNSDFFRRLFFENAKDGRILGATDESAIALPDVSQHDFDCLLSFLYFKYVVYICLRSVLIASPRTPGCSMMTHCPYVIG